MAVVIFDPIAFRLRYPEFNAVSNMALNAYFNEATLYLSNSDCSPVQDHTRRAMLLNMLTAHVGFLGGALSTDGQARPVGRVSQATEGSVSATFEGVPPTPGTGAYFQQSQYGASFWQATASLRGMMYRPRPTNINPQGVFNGKPYVI
jgi:hypothetical protein